MRCPRRRDNDGAHAGRGLSHHAQALGAGNLDEIAADYADGAVVISPAGVKRGKDGIRAAFTQSLADAPNAS